MRECRGRERGGRRVSVCNLCIVCDRIQALAVSWIVIFLILEVLFACICSDRTAMA